MPRPIRKIHIDTIPSECAETEMVKVIAKISEILLRVEARRQAKLEAIHLSEPQQSPSD